MGGPEWPKRDSSDVAIAFEFWLSDGQFDWLRSLLRDKPWVVPRVDDRPVISGIIHVLISGGKWIDAPPVYEPRKTLVNL